MWLGDVLEYRGHRTRRRRNHPARGCERRRARDCPTRLSASPADLDPTHRRDCPAARAHQANRLVHRPGLDRPAPGPDRGPGDRPAALLYEPKFAGEPLCQKYSLEQKLASGILSFHRSPLRAMISRSLSRSRSRRQGKYPCMQRWISSTASSMNAFFSRFRTSPPLTLTYVGEKGPLS